MNNKLKPYLAVLMIISVIAITFSLLKQKVPSENNDVIMLIIGAMVGTVKDLYAYYFGSSESSQRKTELLAKTDP